MNEAIQPTLNRLSKVLPEYGARFDRTLASARLAIGDHCDPSNRAHAVALRGWLNKWICHIRVPEAGESDPFVANLAEWWPSAERQLPDESLTLARLTDHNLDAIASAYGTLQGRTAAVNRSGQARTFAPTATSKILYFVRPQAVTPWDKAISRHVPGHGAAAFRAHLEVCRSFGQELIQEAALGGLTEAEIGPSLGRPDSSVAKLIDEWLYQTITRRVHPKMS